MTLVLSAAYPTNFTNCHDQLTYSLLGFSSWNLEAARKTNSLLITLMTFRVPDPI